MFIIRTMYMLHHHMSKTNRCIDTMPFPLSFVLFHLPYVTCNFTVKSQHNSHSHKFCILYTLLIYPVWGHYFAYQYQQDTSLLPRRNILRSVNEFKQHSEASKFTDPHKNIVGFFFLNCLFLPQIQTKGVKA